MALKTPMWRRYLTFWGRGHASDIRDEIEFHVEARTRELIDRGWAPWDAEREARRQFGDPGAILSECHSIGHDFEKGKRMTRYFNDFKSDVQFALRQFRRQPQFWAAIILTLVVGIAASTCIF